MTAQVALLAVTGTYLFFWYRPSPPASWYDAGGHLDNSIRFEEAVKNVHSADARVLFATVLAFAIVIAVEHLGRDRVTPWLLLAVSGAATLTGLLLPWDQLALWAVTVGTNMAGYRAILDHQVRFVILGDAEIDTSTLIHWLIVHVVLGAVAVAGALRMLLVIRSARTRGDAADPIHTNRTDRESSVAGGRVRRSS